MKIAHQLDLTTVELTPELSSPNTDPNVDQMSVRRQPDTSYEPAIVGQLKECVEALTEKVNQLSASVSNISEVATIRAENPRRGRRGPCYNCGGVGHLSSECRQTKRRNDRGQRQNENYCFLCGQQGHFARDCQYRYQGPRQPKQGNPLLGQGSAHNANAIPINSVSLTAVFIKATLGERQQRCLVDTGATVSLVNKDLVVGPIRECTLRARGVGGESLHILGMTDISVRMNNFRADEQFPCGSHIRKRRNAESVHFGRRFPEGQRNGCKYRTRAIVLGVRANAITTRGGCTNH